MLPEGLYEAEWEWECEWVTDVAVDPAGGLPGGSGGAPGNRPRPCRLDPLPAELRPSAGNCKVLSPSVPGWFTSSDRIGEGASTGAGLLFDRNSPCGTAGASGLDDLALPCNVCPAPRSI